MSDDFDFDKELAPVAKDLISGSSKQAVQALTGILTKFFTGSAILTHISETALANAMSRTSQGRLEKEYQALAKEEQEQQLRAYLVTLFNEVQTGRVNELVPVIREVVAEDGVLTRDRVDTRADEILSAIRSLKKTDATSPAAVVQLPYVSIGDLFKGRDDMLIALRERLQKNDVSAITQARAVHGLGGVGKTRLAVEYAWRYRSDYRGIFFVGAASPQILNANLARLTDRDVLNLNECCDRPEPVQVAAVMGWFKSHTGWLVILDNVDDDAAAQAVEALLPGLHNGHVMITSRLSSWGSLATEPLRPISQAEAVAFLLARTVRRTPSETDDTNAASLAEKLGSLPLALEQASAYINRNRLSLATYLDKWEREREKLFAWFDERRMKYPHSVAVTWKRTFDDVSPTAQTVLLLCSFFAPNDIPIAMLESPRDLVQEALELHTGTTGETEMDIADAIAELDEYSLVGRTGDFISVHKMVQEVMRSWISEDAQGKWIGIALEMVNQYAPSEPPPDDVRSWPIWDPLRPHAEKVFKHGERAGLDESLAFLANQLGLYLDARALYGEAEPLYRRALEIGETTLGKDHPKAAIRLNNLAKLLQATNRLSEAEPLMRRALEIVRNSFGDAHPRTILYAENLDMLLAELN